MDDAADVDVEGALVTVVVYTGNWLVQDIVGEDLTIDISQARIYAYGVPGIDIGIGGLYDAVAVGAPIYISVGGRVVNDDYQAVRVTVDVPAVSAP